MEDEVLLVAMWMMLYLVIRKRRRNIRWRNRRWWVRPVNQNRRNQGDANNLFQEIKEDEIMFHRYTRMDVRTFNNLLNLVRPYLLKHHPRALSPEQRLSLTLRYLATGDQVLSAALAYRIGESTARIIIKEAAEVLVRVLSPVYLRQPTGDHWRNIASSFLERWNFPNCVGAIDGKRVQVQAPPNSSSLYFNYKKTFSIMLLAVCDANYNFTLVHVGEMGGNSDAGIFADCPLGQQLREDQLGIPAGVNQLPGSDIQLPYFLVGDEAFPLSNRMMRPYSGRGLNAVKKIFNYRLSRARRVIENAVGISSSRWRVFRKPITLGPESVYSIIVAAVCLHNFLKTQDEAQELPSRLYVPQNFVDREDENGVLHPGRWREQDDLRNEDGPAPLQFEPPNSIAMRNVLAEYLTTLEGEVPWQYEYIRRTGNPVE